jgi:hypothetical protein
MKTIVKIIVVIGSVLSCAMTSAQDTCTNTVKINDSLVLSVSNCNIFEIPREFLKYSNSYSIVTFFAELVFNDSIYHDSTELKLKSVEIYALGFQDPKDTETVGNLIVQREYLDKPPCGWSNGKRNRFLRKSTREFYQIIQKGIFTLIFLKQQSTPFFFDTITITFVEHL